MDEAKRAALTARLPQGTRIVGMSLLSGGAIQQNWALDVEINGQPAQWVLRTDSTATLTHSRPRSEEFALLKAAFAAGVTVPEPLLLCDDTRVIGAPFFIMRRVHGTAAGHLVVRSETLAGGREAAVAAMGRELARIHSVKAAFPFLAPHPPMPPMLRFVGEMRAHLDAGRTPRPVLEWGLRYLERHAPPVADIVLCHNDFRTGNLMLNDQGVTGVLDWEFAAYGDRHEDLGWLCARCWRFGSKYEAGGIGSRDAFYAGYSAESGHPVDTAQVRLWEIAATIRWAVIAISQAERHLSGAEENLELALTGHIVPELERDILRATT